jgi:photosystem II stability/assembly factor-like uncharacterized protein
MRLGFLALGGLPLAVAAALAYAPPALANGRFPRAGQVAIDPSDPNHIVARATFGLLTTQNAGKRWDWICEYAMGYATGSIEDPAIGITEDGTLVAALLEGLTVSASESCAWSFAGGGLSDQVFSDLSIEPTDPKGVVALVSGGIGGGMFITQVWQSADNAQSWNQAGVDLPAELLGLTLDVAPSDPDRIYVVGTVSPSSAGTIARTEDRGASWTLLPTASGATGVPYLSAIDPDDPDLVYVRVDDDPFDSLLVSSDGGLNWTTVFQSQGDLLGFALSPDGSTVTVGGPKDGIWSAPAATLEFERVSTVGARCLTWVSRGLFACADEVDGFEVGLSEDGGKTFSAVMHLQEICGPLACAPDTIVGRECTGYWPVISNLILAPGCDTPASNGSASGETPPESSGGCGCRSAAPYPADGTAPENGSPVLVLLLGGSMALVRREQRRRRKDLVRRPTGR